MVWCTRHQQTPLQQTPNERHNTWRMSTWRFFAECFFLVCRVFFSTRQRVCLSSAIILPSVFFTALNKELVCRIPDIMHLTNIFALGKYAVSGSVGNKESWIRYYKRHDTIVILHAMAWTRWRGEVACHIVESVKYVATFTIPVAILRSKTKIGKWKSTNHKDEK